MAHALMLRYSRVMVRIVEARKVLLACLLALPAQAQAQEAPERMMLEAGITDGNSIACPEHYIGIEDSHTAWWRRIDAMWPLNPQPAEGIGAAGARLLVGASGAAYRARVQRGRPTSHTRWEPP